MILKEPQADVGGENAMKIERLVVGAISTNCYLVMNEDTRDGFIVDPGDSEEKISAAIQKLNMAPKAILLTHGHFDHILAAEDIRKLFSIPIYVGEAEKEIIEDSQGNLSGSFGKSIALKPDQYVRDGQKLKIADFDIQVIHTPGHTKGGVCYYISSQETVFSGDTLFCESVGRSDFPTGSGPELIRSIRNKLLVLPDCVRVYPGHDQGTTIGHEKAYNAFL